MIARLRDSWRSARHRGPVPCILCGREHPDTRRGQRDHIEDAHPDLARPEGPMARPRLAPNLP